MQNPRAHWESIYKTKSSDQVSWTQTVPQTSLDLIHSFGVSKDAPIIDVGGGESRFVDFLLDEGFSNITVLDISEQALKRTQERLGSKASKVTWIVSDITEFKPVQKFAVWHDRATFHFLTTKEEVEKYVNLASQFINHGGYLAIGTFSEKGPTQCSGLDIKRYTENELEQALTYHFKKIRCLNEDHITPFQTVQNFLFCSFRRAA